MTEPLVCGKTNTYAPGNLGDLIKHSWLIETSRLLLYEVGDKPFVYVDAFAGRPEYPLAPDGWGVWRNKVQTSTLARFQRDSEIRGKYAGSTTLVSLVCKEASIPCEVRAYDTEEGCRGALSESGAVLLDLKSGYDVLGRAPLLDRANLLLLDPYNFLPRTTWKKHIVGLVNAAEHVPTLLFLYNKTRYRRNYDSFRTNLAELARDRVTGCVGRLRGTSAWYEMMFLHKKPDRQMLPIAEVLQRITTQLVEAIDVASKFETVG